MLTPDQAFRLFVYADWAMMLLGLALIVAAIGWGISAILPRNRGRRRQVFLKGLVCLLVAALFYGTQASVLIAFLNPQWTALQLVLFGLPFAIMLAGLIASLTYGAVGILRRAGLRAPTNVAKIAHMDYHFRLGHRTAYSCYAHANHFLPGPHKFSGHS